MGGDRTAADWREWRQTPGSGSEEFQLGALLPDLLPELKRIRGAAPKSPTVTITRNELRHAQRSSKQARGQALDEADVDRLPDAIECPGAVLHDSCADALVYAFTPANRQGKVAKVVVRMNYRQKVWRDGERQRVTSNAVRTSGYVGLRDLRQRRYKLIWGKLN